MSARDLPAFDTLSRLLDNWNGANTSFFTWFGYVSSRRWVSAEESVTATEAEKERRQKITDGKVQEGEEEEELADPEDELLEQQVEVHDEGDTLASVIAEDLWSGAIKYFSECEVAVSMQANADPN